MQLFKHALLVQPFSNCPVKHLPFEVCRAWDQALKMSLSIAHSDHGLSLLRCPLFGRLIPVLNIFLLWIFFSHFRMMSSKFFQNLFKPIQYWWVAAFASLVWLLMFASQLCMLVFNVCWLTCKVELQKDNVLKHVFIHVIKPLWTRYKIINWLICSISLEMLLGNPPSVKPPDQGESILVRWQVRWWDPVLLRVLLSVLTRSGEYICVIVMGELCQIIHQKTVAHYDCIVTRII